MLWFFNFYSFATNYYVDNTANGSNNGTSWESAWESFSDINWSLIDPGDIIYISGGSLSKTYTSGISVNASGSFGLPITITKGIDANHNGEVILQSPGSGRGVYIKNEKFIIVSNLTINNWYTAISIDGDYSNAAHNVIIDNCDGIMKGRFIMVQGSGTSGSNCYDITVRNCNVSTPASTGSQNDFVYAQYMAGLTVENNKVIIASNDASRHNDLIQTFWVDGPVIVRNNYFEHSNNKQRNSQGIFFENHEGDYLVYNNIIVMPNSLDGKIYWKSSSLNNAHTIIYGNVSYGKGGSLIKTTDPNAVIKNNILYSTGYVSSGSSHMLEFNGVLGNNADITNNLFYDPAGNMSNQNSGNCTDCDEDDPLFNNISSRDFTLQTSSPAIDMGATLGSPYNVDRIGTIRPQGPFFDAGAYESVDNSNGNYIVVNSGWNCISIPKLNENMTIEYLLPTRTSPVYEFTSDQYNSVTKLENGKGYMVEFASQQNIFIGGDSVNFQIPVIEGWNLIGPFDTNVPISQINSVPPGIIISSFWELDISGYEMSNMLIAGKGYWVNVGSDGMINLDGEGMSKSTNNHQRRIETLQSYGKIIVKDIIGNNIVLYGTERGLEFSKFELPPIHPSQIFDVSFSDRKFVEDLSSAKNIIINSATYPVSIKVVGLNLALKDNINGEFLNTILKSGQEIVINDQNINSIEVLVKASDEYPTSFELNQNYPNPFNPTTKIRFTIPSNINDNEINVTLKIFDILGNAIETIIDESKTPGEYEIEFSAKNLPSGVYFYKFQATYDGNILANNHSEKIFEETRKMVLIR